MSTEKIDYALAGEYADVIHAIAIVESGENPYAVGDGGRAFGLLQMHPARFVEEFHYIEKYEAAVAYSWTEAQIRVCSWYLLMYEDAPLDLRVMAWRLGKVAVFQEGKRDWEYWGRVEAELKKLEGGSGGDRTEENSHN